MLGSLLLLGADSSLLVGTAMEDRDERSIDVRGSLLLLTGAPLLLISPLVFRERAGPSLLLGRYNMESFAFEGATPRLGVTLPSINAEDCDTRLTCVGVIGVGGIETLCWRDGGE